MRAYKGYPNPPPFDPVDRDEKMHYHKYMIAQVTGHRVRTISHMKELWEDFESLANEYLDMGLLPDGEVRVIEMKKGNLLTIFQIFKRQR